MASTSTVAGYNVYRAVVSGGGFRMINGAMVLATSFTDANVQAGETYTYQVTAVGLTGLESDPSEQLQVTVPTP